MKTLLHCCGGGDERGKGNSSSDGHRTKDDSAQIEKERSKVVVSGRRIWHVREKLWSHSGGVVRQATE